MRRLCSVAGCGEQPVGSGSRCAAHARQRRKATAATYSAQLLYKRKRWRVVRKRVLFDNPLCVKCGDIATDVDHIVPLRDSVDPFKLSNLQSLCKRCHSRKTRREVAVPATG